MSAFAELQSTGRVGGETVALLERLVGQVARTSSFPPVGHGAWTKQAVVDYVAEILTTVRGNGMILQCAMTATDDGSLERLLLASIRNRLIDEAKSTPVGKLRRRMRTLLGNDGRFFRADSYLAGEEAWTVEANADSVWMGDLDDLERLTADVVVEPIRQLNRAGPTPAAARVSIVTMSFETLARARGAIRAQVLARFLFERFDFHDVEATGASGEDVPERELTSGPDDPVAILADEIASTLSKEDLEIVRDSQRISAAGHDPARDDLVERLRAHLGSDIGRDAVQLVIRRSTATMDES